MMTRGVFLASVVLVAGSAALEAQNSIYAIRGIGFPQRAYSTRARGAGGALAWFDGESAVNSATLANVRNLTVSGALGATFREYDAVGVNATDLKDTRFPLAMVAGSFGGWPLSFGVSFSGYTERTFDVLSSGVDTVSGQAVAVEDRIRSTGGINDIRAAVGWILRPTLHVGGAFHLITGSTNVEAKREFETTELATFLQRSGLTFTGVGFSAGVDWYVNPQLTVAATGRVDNKLHTSVDDRTSTKIDLPVSLSAAVSYAVTPKLLVAAAGEWQSWSVAEGQLDAETKGVFDTIGISSGLEFLLLSALPIRLGGRYGTLPFSPSATEQPTEWLISGGLGTRVARGRARLDFAVERLIREGAGATERAWHLVFGIAVTP